MREKKRATSKPGRTKTDPGDAPLDKKAVELSTPDTSTGEPSGTGPAAASAAAPVAVAASPKAAAIPAPEAVTVAPEPAAPPASPPPPAPVAGSAEFAELLHPSEIKSGNPESPAPAPGRAPPGDSRSFRRHRDGEEQFCLIYRVYNSIVQRDGVVGKQGTWTVVDYPSQSNSCHAFAVRTSELMADGFRDFRS